MPTPKLGTNFAEISKWYGRFYDILASKLGVTLTGKDLVNLSNQMSGSVTRYVKQKAKKHAKEQEGVSGAPATNNAGQEDIKQVASSFMYSLGSEIAGLLLTRELIDHTALRLAGSITKLREGIVLEPWYGYKTKQWAICEVTDARYHQTKRKKLPGAILSILVWSGPGAGHEFEQFFTSNALDYIASRTGLKSRRGPWIPMNFRQMVRAKLLLLLESDDETRAIEWDVSASLKGRNKSRVISRANKLGCNDTKVSQPCTFCHHGYGVCSNGTHSEEYVQKTCVKGHRGWFPPRRLTTGYCLDCQGNLWQQRNGSN